MVPHSPFTFISTVPSWGPVPPTNWTPKNNQLKKKKEFKKMGNWWIGYQYNH